MSEPKSGDEYHVKVVCSTKPGHKVLRRESCNCPIGGEHSVFESP